VTFVSQKMLIMFYLEQSRIKGRSNYNPALHLYEDRARDTNLGTAMSTIKTKVCVLAPEGLLKSEF
jgi:hypothetical protein